MANKTIKLKKISLLIISCILLFSCHPSADKYFGIAALNCNAFSRFGSYEIKEFLQGTPQVYDADKKVMRTSTFQEYFKFRFLDYAIENYNELKDLPVTDDTRAMITASRSLFEFCVSKYEHEYMEIAKMSDEHQPQSKINAALKNFDSTYMSEYTAKYEGAWAQGLAYAKANGIPVTTVNSHVSP